MQAVLYIGHGSRVKAGVREAIHFIEKAKAHIDVSIQEVCFLELAEPNIMEGITQCVERGATQIAIIPILLLTAGHAKEDIPIEIEKAKMKYPQIRFTYGETFGIHPKLIDSLYDRILEQNVEISSNAMILLVGRGSSDPVVKQDLSQIANCLKETYHFQKVDICFLYGAKPHFDEALIKLQKAKHKQVFIIPYLLFSGLLMNGIEKKISQIKGENQQLILCETLGYHPNFQTVLLERVNELLEKTELAI
ncbi:sirohydrochlorin chelatase [Lederbergia lenta]|uniref:sirohydrochlorin chelatase n=1 Tax=Lederbergia lenta TaxID=1467 RepID=UPI00203F7633|nr:sirohydrochlorin chelatase [Lederbergia lenta]MCM3109505.1 sirohydrochlorin chelatase [Lederbergia lenta]